MRRTNLKNLSGRFQVAAMVDIFFLLLIFILLSSSTVPLPGFNVELVSISDPEMEGAEKIFINMVGDMIILNGTVVAKEELSRKITDLVVSSKTIGARRMGMEVDLTDSSLPYTPKVTMIVDKSISQEQMAEVYDIVRSLNLNVYQLVEPSR